MTDAHHMIRGWQVCIPETANPWIRVQVPAAPPFDAKKAPPWRGFLLTGTSQGLRYYNRIKVYKKRKIEIAQRFLWWAGKVSNLRRHKPADLQSAPFDHFGTCP